MVVGCVLERDFHFPFPHLKYIYFMCNYPSFLSFSFNANIAATKKTGLLKSYSCD